MQEEIGTVLGTNRIPALAAKILEQPDHFELLSLDPVLDLDASEGVFHRYRILGKADVTDLGTRRKLVSSFERAVAENKGYVAHCFNPRHGIHVTKGNKEADFVICFECSSVQTHGVIEDEFLVSNTRETFNSVLQNYRVPLPDR
jgi:hypothetical protein